MRPPQIAGSASPTRRPQPRFEPLLPPAHSPPLIRPSTHPRSPTTGPTDRDIPRTVVGMFEDLRICFIGGSFVQGIGDPEDRGWVAACSPEPGPAFGAIGLLQEAEVGQVADILGDELSRQVGDVVVGADLCVADGGSESVGGEGRSG